MTFELRGATRNWDFYFNEKQFKFWGTRYVRSRDLFRIAKLDFYQSSNVIIKYQDKNGLPRTVGGDDIFDLEQYNLFVSQENPNQKNNINNISNYSEYECLKSVKNIIAIFKDDYDQQQNVVIDETK